MPVSVAVVISLLVKLLVIVLVLAVVVWLTSDVPPVVRAGVLLGFGAVLTALAKVLAGLR